MASSRGNNPLSASASGEVAAVFAFVSQVYGVLAVIFWCYIRFAIWLTKPDEKEAADQR